MADTQKTTKTLTMEATFADGDTRTIAIDNPDTSKNLVSLINDLSSYCATNNILLGDQASANFSRIASAKLNTKAITTLDLS